MIFELEPARTLITSLEFLSTPERVASLTNKRDWLWWRMMTHNELRRSQRSLISKHHRSDAIRFCAVTLDKGRLRCWCVSLQRFSFSHLNLDSPKAIKARDKLALNSCSQIVSIPLRVSILNRSSGGDCLIINYELFESLREKSQKSRKHLRHKELSFGRKRFQNDWFIRARNVPAPSIHEFYCLAAKYWANAYRREHSRL